MSRPENAFRCSQVIDAIQSSLNCLVKLILKNKRYKTRKIFCTEQPFCIRIFTSVWKLTAPISLLISLYVASYKLQFNLLRVALINLTKYFNFLPSNFLKQYIGAHCRMKGSRHFKRIVFFRSVACYLKKWTYSHNMVGLRVTHVCS